MPVTRSRRDVLNFGCGTAAAIGACAVATSLAPVPAAAQGASAGNPATDDFRMYYEWGAAVTIEPPDLTPPGKQPTLP